MACAAAAARATPHSARRVQLPRFNQNTRSPTASRGSKTTVLSTTLSTLFALDFDGVVCDSVNESSLSAWAHGEELWPEVFNNDGAQTQKSRVISELRAVRPVVETGYENTLLARALLEKKPGYSVEQILDDWERLSSALMLEWGLDRRVMVEAFGNVRDRWMARDFDSWLAPNALYEGVPEALRAAQDRDDVAVKIVTTKQARFATAIMAKIGNIVVEDCDMYSTTTSGIPKTAVLESFRDTMPNAARRVFVEDKLSTLEKVCKVEALDDWELFLVDWGYNTASERERASANPRIEVIGVETFIELLRKG